MTLADIVVASPFVNLAHCDVGPDTARWPRTAGCVDAILARPSFADMVASECRTMAALG